MKVFYFYLIAFAIAEDLPTGAVVGDEVAVLMDKTVKVPDEDSTPKCRYMRTVKLQYNTTQVGAQENHPFIYYKVIQCKDKNMKVTGEKVYFSYSKNAAYQPLPAGCPPPIV